MKNNWQLKLDLKTTRKPGVSKIRHLKSDKYTIPFLANVTFFGKEFNNPGYKLERDNAPSYLFCYTEDGSANIEYLGKSFTVKKGDFLVLDLSNHSLITSDDVWNIYFIHARSGMTNDFYYEIINRVGYIIHSFDPTFFIKTIEKMIDKFDKNKLDEYEINQQVNNILTDVLRQSKNKEERIENPTLRIVVDYINKNYANGILLNDVCKNVGITNAYLSRLFLRELSVHPSDYLMNLKLRKAFSLLKFTRLTIREVAILSGFKTEKNMYNFFRRRMSSTPAQYRKEMGNKSIVG